LGSSLSVEGICAPHAHSMQGARRPSDRAGLRVARMLATVERRKTIHGCTVATHAYIAHARVLAESFLEHNPGSRFWVLIVDDSGRVLEYDDELFEVLTPEQVGLDQAELHRRATMYTTQALSCSLKPVLLLALLARAPGPVVYLDADSCVYAGLRPLADACEAHSLVLSPHLLDPYPLAGLDSAEQVILRVGVFNGGLLGIGPGAEQALRWWSARTARRCIFDERLGLVFDQTWLTLMPLLFERHHVLRDRACNVAGWNLHTRDVEWEGDLPLIDGAPLKHFHFAGSFDPEHPETITPIEHLASWWAKLEQRPGAARLAHEYAQRLIAHGYREARSSTPLHDLMPDGTPIALWMRESYRVALLEAEERGASEPPNPFSHGQERFHNWMERRAREVASSSSSSSSSEERSLPVDREALAEALMDSRRLLARISELEGIRDDAIDWAQRVSAELQDASARIELISSERDQILLERQQISGERDRLQSERERDVATIEAIRQSASWRITRPLRQAQAALKGSSGNSLA
jgi:hypothetical protein